VIGSAITDRFVELTNGKIDAKIALLTCQFVKPSNPDFSGPCKAFFDATFKNS